MINLFHKKAILHFARYGFPKETVVWKKDDFVKSFNKMFFYKEKRLFTSEEKNEMLDYLLDRLSYISYTQYTRASKIKLIESARKELK